MGIMADIKQKREDFYNSIKNISFEVVTITGEEYTNYLRRIIQIIGINSKSLYDAIITRTKRNKNKSESDKYLAGILENVVAMKGIEKEIEKKSSKDDERIYKNLLARLNLLLRNLGSACAKSGNAKFSKTTIGAVLEYKPTLEKFKKLSKEIDALRIKIKSSL